MMDTFRQPLRYERNQEAGDQPLRLEAQSGGPGESLWKEGGASVVQKEHMWSYGELTECTKAVAANLDCFWPNTEVDRFFVAVHRHYFRLCAISGRSVQDPARGILCPFIVLPILVTLLMTALVVWRSKRTEGIV
ncbi:receptor activity-modifying protein 1 isoform 2-T2 [Callospermophilus lateralis]|uniref:receptor activity-modifying protein 1 isoform X2 n=1 Tax=Callospermophilus lateralis TaxID=76772 RepID=UPI0040385EFF